MLKSVHFENFVVFEQAEKIVFGDQSPFIFIGENGSGKSAVFEGIRRCLNAKLNTSFSKPCDQNLPSYFMCRFEIDKKSDIISGTFCIPISQASQTIDPNLKNKDSQTVYSTGMSQESQILEPIGMSQDSRTLDPIGIGQASPALEPSGTTYRAFETDTLIYYQFVITYNEKKVDGFHVDSLKLIRTQSDETDIHVQPASVDASAVNTLNDLYDIVSGSQKNCENKIGEILLNIFSYKLERNKLSGLSECQKLLTELSKQVVFTFPLRSIGPLQWSESIKIAAKERKKNYLKAAKRCEIIQTFLSQDNDKKFDKDIESRIFEKITNMSKQYRFSLDKKTGDLLVQNNQFELLKTPEGILEAKYVSILLSGKQYQTILLEEPDRGMHPQFVHRMIQAIQQQARENRKVVILTTHNTAFLTPWTLSNCFRFSRVGESRRIRCLGGIKKDLTMLRLMTNDNLSHIFFAKHMLFCEGPSDLLFLTELVNLIKARFETKQSVTGRRLLCAENKFQFLRKDQQELLQRTLTDLTISKMDSKNNLKKCQEMCKLLGLPAKFVLDTDAQNVKKLLFYRLSLYWIRTLKWTTKKAGPDRQGTVKRVCKLLGLPAKFVLDKDAKKDCFFWSDGAIEQMVIEMAKKYKDEILQTNADKLTSGKKLFLDKVFSPISITDCVDSLLRFSAEDNDIGQLLLFMTKV